MSKRRPESGIVVIWVLLALALSACTRQGQPTQAEAVRVSGVGGRWRRAGDGRRLRCISLSRRFRLGEKLQLEALLEGFNVFNRANLQLPNNVFGTGITPLPSFGQPTGAADPRQLQFGLRLSF